MKHVLEGFQTNRKLIHGRSVDSHTYLTLKPLASRRSLISEEERLVKVYNLTSCRR